MFEGLIVNYSYISKNKWLRIVNLNQYKSKDINPIVLWIWYG